ncbi:MAG: bifunctional chorismate mutase/prephenate dehydratase [Acidobacteria bacterium]|nr:bifunctional chorismate mutase/prephenate dehydratase [Acidobacteriota bacterium]
MTVRDLADLRRSLDDIDKVILSALGERARLARDITAAKSGAEQPLRDEAREQAILAHRTEFGERVGLDPVLVRRLYRAILDDSVRRQQEWLNDPPVTEAPLVVGYQGTEGAYGFQAARQHFGVSRRPVTLKAYRSFREVLEAVQNGDVERAVLPIENSTAGSVHDVYDLLFRLSLSIVGEEVLVIEHCLLAPAGVGLADLTHVHSHPQALAQCSEFLAELPGVDPEVAPNTALAAERVAREARPGHAAIASEEAGVRFGLHVLKRQIANQPMNLTRFVVIASAPDACDPLVDAKVSLVFGTRHERGALVRCLNILADEGVNLCKLESRPRAGVAWEYVFYADVEGHLSTPAMQGALTRLSGATQFVRVLGCYPACAAKPPL